MRKIRIALTPPGWTLRTRLRDGTLIEGRNINGWGARGIYLNRDEIEPEFRSLAEMVDLGHVFIDIGANTGIYTLRAARLVGEKGVVIAMEPFPEMAVELHRNVMLNRLTNVRIRAFCAGGSTGPAEFWANFGKPNSFSLLRIDPAASCLSVLKVRLDELWAWEKLPRLDYIKIDAEGAEREILDGAMSVIAHHRPIVQAEVVIKNLHFPVSSYVAYRAMYSAGKASPNVVFIPEEHPKIAVAKRLGWLRIDASEFAGVTSAVR